MCNRWLGNVRLRLEHHNLIWQKPRKRNSRTKQRRLPERVKTSMWSVRLHWAERSVEFDTNSLSTKRSSFALFLNPV